MQAASDEDGKPVARDLTRGPIGKTLLVFALPILAGNVLQSLNGSVSAIWVGRYLGEAALALTALTTPLEALRGPSTTERGAATTEAADAMTDAAFLLQRGSE